MSNSLPKKHERSVHVPSLSPSLPPSLATYVHHLGALLAAGLGDDKHGVQLRLHLQGKEGEGGKDGEFV
jgi:hypothetical protein